MIKRLLIAFVAAAISITPLQANSVTFVCEFNDRWVIEHYGYTCTLEDIIGNDTQIGSVELVGDHVKGRSMKHVINLLITAEFPSMFSQFTWIFPNLKVLYLFNTGIEEIRENAFSLRPNFNLEILEIEGASLGALRANSFFGLFNLRSLSLWSCQLETIHNQAFVGLQNLEELNLFDNKVRVLSPSVLQPLTNLRYFSALHNDIRRIRADTFQSNARLFAIILNNNLISRIDRPFLSGLNSLQFLFLSGNRCVNQNFMIASSEDFGVIYEQLERCFEEPTTTTTTSIETTQTWFPTTLTSTPERTTQTATEATTTRRISTTPTVRTTTPRLSTLRTTTTRRPSTTRSTTTRQRSTTARSSESSEEEPKTTATESEQTTKTNNKKTTTIPATQTASTTRRQSTTINSSESSEETTAGEFTGETSEEN